jgi:hypothetical protein
MVLGANGMAKFREKASLVEAVKWVPDPSFGTFEGGRYLNRRVGADALGVEYTVTEVGLSSELGFMRLRPGDYIVTPTDGERYTMTSEHFAQRCETAEAGTERRAIEAGDVAFLKNCPARYRDLGTGTALRVIAVDGKRQRARVDHVKFDGVSTLLVEMEFLTLDPAETLPPYEVPAVPAKP